MKENLQEAVLYTKNKDKSVVCRLCGHHCFVANGAAGRCRVRINRDGILYSINYGQVIACNVDPIEKKPLYHFYPASFSYSIACPGCNFQCKFCQNWQISQKEAVDPGYSAMPIKPEKVVEAAGASGCQSIAYTYTEPTVFFEFARDCAVLARKQGMSNIFVSNGFMTGEAIGCISPYLDAANIDLKSFRDSFYRDICKGRLKPVLESIKEMKKREIWIELTTLVIPGLNDSKEELNDIAEFIASVHRDIPWHISRFYPQYKMEKAEPTPLATLEKAYDIGKKNGLAHIYIGNIATEKGNNTYCPGCQALLIRRSGFRVEENLIDRGRCPQCHAIIPGFFDQG